MRKRENLFLTALAILAGAFVIALVAQSKPTPQPRALPSYCANGRVPSACIFGLSHSPYVILSAYAYEASLLGYSPPVGDFDYMLPYGSEYARLPGGSWNVYGGRGAIYIPGSGWAAEFTAPNGGRFAYLHLQTINAGVGVGSPPPPPNAAQLVLPINRSGDENTAAAAALSVGVARTTASGSYRGNQVVGLTGWPTWAIYGNGSFGPADGHLCVVLDARALAWFWKVAIGGDHKPRAFPIKKWGKTPYRDRRGRLVWSAAWTFHHYQTSVYPHLKGDKWYGHTATRQYGFTEYHFRGSRQGKVLRCWPHYKRCRLTAR